MAHLVSSCFYSRLQYREGAQVISGVMVGAGRHNQLWGGAAGSFKKRTLIMKIRNKRTCAGKTVFSELPLFSSK